MRLVIIEWKTPKDFDEQNVTGKCFGDCHIIRHFYTDVVLIVNG